MDSIKYQEGVLRTESTNFEEIRERLMSDPALLLGALASIRSLAESLDIVKKALFYGRDVKGDTLLRQLGKARLEGMPVNSADLVRAGLTDQMIRLLHSTIGITTEAGELAQALDNAIVQGKALDEVNIIEEYGDQLWYTAQGLDAVNATLPDSMDRNNRKLRKRYPNKFTEESATTRDLDAERRELETSAKKDGGGEGA